VTGLTRYCDANERSVSGVFGTIAKSAILKNTRFGVSVHTAKEGSVFAKISSGKIENCYLDIELCQRSGDATKNSLFATSVGSMTDCVVDWNVTDADGAAIGMTAFAPYGFARYTRCLIISQKVAYGAKLNGFDSDVNPYLTDCFLYKTESDLLSGNGYALVGAGLGDADTQTRYGEFAKTVWSFADTVALKNQANVKPLKAPTLIAEKGATIDLTETYTVTDQTTDGCEFDFYVLSASGKKVHALSEDGLIFRPTAAGLYTLVTALADEDGLTSYSVASIVVENAAALNVTTKNFVFKIGESGKIAIDGKAASDFYYYSDNAAVATVDGEGNVTAISKGTAQIVAVHKTADVSATVTVDVVDVSEIKTVSTAEELLALNGVTGGYYLLTNDVELTWSAEYVYKLETATRTEHYACFLQEFDGTLDGNGYTITVRYENNDAKYIPSGLFYKLNTQSTVKNLHYVFDGAYCRSPNSVFAGLFAYNASGILQDCYMEANVRHLSGSVAEKDKEGFIAIAANPSGNKTAYFNNNIFNLSITDENGLNADMGYAIRFGSRAPNVTDCVFIKNGATKTFYGQNNGGSACEMRTSYFYRTVYDFVTARNGSTMNTARVVTDIPDNVVVYGSWGKRWDISEKGVYLLGRKVADAAYEDYGEAPVMDVSVFGGSLFWAEAGAFDVSVNGEYAGSSDTGAFDVYDVIKSRYGEAGSYDIVVEDPISGKTGIVVFRVVALTQENFLQALSVAESNEYLILTEDVTLDKTAYGSYSSSIWNASYIIGKDFTATLDGQGYKVSCAWTDRSLSGLFKVVRGTIRNLHYEMDATYTVGAADSRGFFAFSFLETAVIENCYIRICTKATSDGVTAVKDEKDSAYLVATNQMHSTGIIRNCILENKTYDPATGKMADKILWKNSIYSVAKNCVFISTLDKLSSQPNAHPQYKSTYENCYIYATLAEYLSGENGYTLDGADVSENAASATKKAVEGAQWGGLNAVDEWMISADGVYLCGTQIYPEPRFLTASVSENMLTLTDTQTSGTLTYDLFVGETKIGSFVGDTFNVVAALEKAGKIAAGENEILVTVKSTDGEATATATVKVYGIDQTNFVTTVKTASANVSA
ncbi:MAG: Ig-like domain-containing protein, partial [Clostridia bacterium]|nr:Ig-like domain-containing protein [Clostridia bacterium]